MYISLIVSYSLIFGLRSQPGIGRQWFRLKKFTAGSTESCLLSSCVSSVSNSRHSWDDRASQPRRLRFHLTVPPIYRIGHELKSYLIIIIAAYIPTIQPLFKGHQRGSISSRDMEPYGRQSRSHGRRFPPIHVSHNLSFKRKKFLVSRYRIRFRRAICAQWWGV